MKAKDVRRVRSRVRLSMAVDLCSGSGNGRVVVVELAVVSGRATVTRGEISCGS